MPGHGVQSGSSIGAHGHMAAKVVRALAPVLVAGSCKTCQAEWPAHGPQKGAFDVGFEMQGSG